MPLYSYSCSECGHKFDQTHDVKDRDTSKCFNCGNEINNTRLIGNVNFELKGSGFFTNDYKKRGL